MTFQEKIDKVTELFKQARKDVDYLTLLPSMDEGIDYLELTINYDNDGTEPIASFDEVKHIVQFLDNIIEHPEVIAEYMNIPISPCLTVYDMDADKILHWTVKEALNEINKDRSQDWSGYNEDDWQEGWEEWVEGNEYKLLKISEG